MEISHGNENFSEALTKRLSSHQSWMLQLCSGFEETSPLMEEADQNQGNPAVHLDNAVEHEQDDRYEHKQEIVDQKNLDMDNVEKVISLMDTANLDLPPEYVKVLIVGRTGTGKSTLINTLFGSTVAKVGEGGGACQHIDLVTTYSLPEIHYKENTTQIIIYDTVGLGETKEKDKAVLDYIRNNVKKIHLLLVCHKLYDKVDRSTEKVLKELANHFNNDVFSHMIILLTHADAYRVYIKGSQEDVIKRKFKERFENMKSRLHEVIARLLKAEVDDFCLVCDDTKFVLPHSANWEYELWCFILHKCDEEAKVALSYFAHVVRKMSLTS